MREQKRRNPIQMDDPGLPSIQLEDIDPEHCYFNPGCAMSLYKPEAVEDIL